MASGGKSPLKQSVDLLLAYPNRRFLANAPPAAPARVNTPITAGFANTQRLSLAGIGRISLAYGSDT